MHRRLKKCSFLSNKEGEKRVGLKKKKKVVCVEKKGSINDT